MQQYLLAEIGDAGVAPEHSVRAAVLMSSSGASLLEPNPEPESKPNPNPNA